MVHHDVYEQHISLKERPANPKRRISEVMSDHLLSSKMCDHSHMVFSRCHTATIRSFGSTLSSSPSDLMTRLSQRGCLACPFLSVTCLLSVFHFSWHNTLHRAQMSHVQKKNIDNGNIVHFDGSGSFILPNSCAGVASVRKAITGVQGRIPLHAKNRVFVLRTWEPEDKPSKGFSRQGAP